jgi:rSAM/selenodomain-associated transferase 1
MDVVLCCAPDASHPFFQDCADDFEIDLMNQLDDANLGARMLASLNEALSDYSRVILIGADCPAFTTAHLLDANAKLSTHDVVITPAEDGGYTLIGVKKTAPTMFANIDWGTNTVMAAQRGALTAASLRWTETAMLWDVDRLEDLARLQTLKPPLAFFLPP